MRFPKHALKAVFALSAALALNFGCRGNDNNPPPAVAPAISTQPANQTVLEGATASFTVTATGTAPLGYQWKKGGTAVTGATSASYTTPATVLADSGSSFTVTVTNSAGSVTSTAATLTVNPAPPTITTQPASRTVTAPATATFTVVATGSGTLSYQWKKGGTDVAGAIAASYTTPATTLADNAASFTVTVTNAQGTVTSNAAILTVQALPAFTTQPAGGTVTAGTAVTFTAAASGNPAPAYQWYKGATLLTGQTAATLTIASATLADAGSYTVTATNSVGSVTSNAAVLVVNQAPVIVTQPISQTIVSGSPVTFSVAATGFPAPTYQWKKNGTAISGQTSTSYTIAAVAPADAGSYTVDVTNAISTTTSAAAVLTVTVPPAITTQPTSQTVTAPATATFTVVATGTPAPTYQWQKNLAPIAGATSTSYTTPATGLADNQASYTVVVTNGVGSPVTSNAAILTVQVAPAITSQPTSQSVIVGQTATFSVTATGNPAPTYQWRKGGLNIGGATAATYTTPVTVIGDDGSSFDVVVSNGIGSPATSLAAILSVAPAPVTPVFLTQPASQTIAAGNSVTFTSNASGTPTPTYQWRKDGTNIGGATNSSYTIASVISTDAGSYTVVATNSQGSATSNAATLTVNYAPVITVQPASQTVSQGTNVTFSVAAIAVPAVTGYQWRFNGSNIPGANGSSYTQNNVNTGNNGSYDVVVTNPVGSTTSSAATLTVTLTYSISGRVTNANNGTGIPGVVISANTTPTATTATTNSNGDYTLSGFANGPYTLTPTLAGASALFFPPTQTVTINNANQNNIQFQASVGYNVSGTVLYSGSPTARVYLRLEGGNGGGSPGVSIATTGTFTIRGVAPGTYTLTAWRDNIGLGFPNASNARGTRTNVIVGFGNATNQDVTITDPGPISLTGAAGPAVEIVSPYNGGAVVFYQPLVDVNGNETADSYVLEASTSATFTTIAKSLTVAAQSDNGNVCFMSGLTDGLTYYFRLKGKAGATTSNAGTATGAIVIGAGTGANTVSGTVTFAGAATGPLAVGVFDESTGQMRVISIASPSSPQAFSLAGVPNGTYFLFGILDQNNNGTIDPGDISNTNGNSSSQVIVTGNLTGQSLILPNTNAAASVTTSHQLSAYTGGTYENYGLQFNVDGNIKLPVNVTLQLGTAVLDVGKPSQDSGYYYWVNLGTLRPTVGAAYTIRVGYSDGTSEDLPVTVSTVLDTFPTNLAPVTPTAAGTTPTFSWAAPSPAPGFPYTYTLWISPSTGGTLWQYPSNGDMPSSQTSVVYNVDGNASQTSLTPGVTYYWTITVRDLNGNQAQKQVEYTP